MWRPSRWPNGYRDAATLIALCVALGSLGAAIGELLHRGRAHA